MTIKDKYKGKVIYAFPTMGKTYCAKLCNKLLDIDVLLKKLFKANTRKQLLNNMKNASVYTYDNNINFIRLQIKFAKKENKTVLLTNDHFKNESDVFFLPKNAYICKKRADERDNINFSQNKIDNKYKSAVTYCNNKNKIINLLEDHEYLSDYIFNKD